MSCPGSSTVKLDDVWKEIEIEALTTSWGESVTKQACKGVVMLGRMEVMEMGLTATRPRLS